jgi:hypothetical protein
VAHLPAVGGNRNADEETGGCTGVDSRARPARLCRREGRRPDPVRDLQNHPAVHHTRCQATVRRPTESRLTPRLAPQHCRSSSGGRRGGECHSRLAAAFQASSHGSLPRPNRGSCLQPCSAQQHFPPAAGRNCPGDILRSRFTGQFHDIAIGNDSRPKWNREDKNKIASQLRLPCLDALL